MPMSCHYEPLLALLPEDAAADALMPFRRLAIEYFIDCRFAALIRYCRHFADAATMLPRMLMSLSLMPPHFRHQPPD